MIMKLFSQALTLIENSLITGCPTPVDLPCITLSTSDLCIYIYIYIYI